MGWVRMHREGLGAGLLFFILALLFHWHSLLHPMTSVGSLTDELLIAWSLDWDAQYFLHPHRSLFDAPYFAPFPGTLAYTEHVAGLALIALPITLITHEPLVSLNLLIILSTWLTGWCAWLLARRIGIGFWGSIVAGIVASFAPTRISHAPGHINILSQWWIPLSLYCLHRYRAEGSRRMLLFLGACVVGQGLVSPQGLMLQLTALAVVGAALTWRRDVVQGKWHRMVLALLISLVVLSPVLSPYLAVTRDPQILRPPWLRLLHAPSFSELLLPRWSLPIDHFERLVAPGLMPILILALGLLAWRHAVRARWLAPRAEEVLPYVMLALVGLLLALGPAMTLVRDGPSIPGLYAVFEHLPGFSAIRAVGRFALLAVLGIAVCVGFTWDVIARWAGRGGRMLQIILLSFLIAEFTIAMPVPFSLDAGLLAERPVDTWLRGLSQECIIAEVPFKDFRTKDEEAALFIYHNRFHGKRLIDGYAGAAPQGYFTLEKQLVIGPVDDALDGLKEWGADYLVVHSSLFTPARSKIFLETLSSRNDIEAMTRFPDDFVFRFKGNTLSSCL